MAKFYISKADGTLIFATPSSGITAISDTGAVTLGGSPTFGTPTTTGPIILTTSGMSTGGTGAHIGADASGNFNFSTSGSTNIGILVPGATSTAVITLPGSTGTLVTLAGAEELTNKTLTSSVGKGTWTASGTWTLPAFTINSAITGGASSSLALGGATIGTNAFAATGTGTMSGALSLTANTAATSTTTGTLIVTGGIGATGKVWGSAHELAATTATCAYGMGFSSSAIGTLYHNSSPLAAWNSTVFMLYDTATLAWSSTSSVNGTNDTFLGRGAAAATVRQGAADAATCVAQTTKVQSIVTGTADIAGANWTLQGSKSTGSAASGDIIFQVGGKGAASTTVNTLNTGLTIKAGTTNNTNVGYPSVIIGTAALATTATDGFLYIPTCAGTPAGTPTAATGRVPIVYDTTNDILYIYNDSWKKAVASLVTGAITWQ